MAVRRKKVVEPEPQPEPVFEEKIEPVIPEHEQYQEARREAIAEVNKKFGYV